MESASSCEGETEPTEDKVSKSEVAVRVSENGVRGGKNWEAAPIGLGRAMQMQGLSWNKSGDGAYKWKF